MSKRLVKKMPSEEERINFLKVIHFEAKRVSLDAQFVLALIETASDFKKYSVSQSGARGYMQVHPDWVALTGSPDDNLFHLRTNIRYGCVILKQNYEDEKGDLTKTLVRFHNAMNRHYGDQIDSGPTDIEFANRVLDTWKSNWSIPTGVSR